MKTLSLAAIAFLLASCAPAGPTEDSQAPEPEVPAPALAAPSDPNVEECFDRRLAVLGELTQLARAHAGPCETAADCTLALTDIDCQRSCPEPVARARAAELASALSAYATAVCPSLPTSCNMGPSCAGLNVACVAGICRAALP